MQNPDYIVEEIRKVENAGLGEDDGRHDHGNLHRPRVHHIAEQFTCPRFDRLQRKHCVCGGSSFGTLHHVSTNACVITHYASKYSPNIIVKANKSTFA